MDIRLRPELEAALIERARQMGRTPEALALDILRERFAKREPVPSEKREGSLEDFLEEYIGVLPGYEEEAGELPPSKATDSRDS